MRHDEKTACCPTGEFWIVKRQHIRCAQAVLLPASTPARTNTPLLTEQSVYSWMAQRQRFPWGSKQTHLPEVTTRYRHSNRSLLPTKALSEKSWYSLKSVPRKIFRDSHINYSKFRLLNTQPMPAPDYSPGNTVERSILHPGKMLTGMIPEE